MTNIFLLQTYDYSAVPNTPAAAAGHALLPGHIDSKGGVWQVQGGHLIGTASGPNPGLDNQLFFNALPAQNAMKMVVTGSTTSNQVSALVRADPSAHAGYYAALYGAYGVWVAGKVAAGSDTRSGQAALSPGYQPGHVYQLVAEMLPTANAAQQAVLHLAVFDLTAPNTAAGQPADPVNCTDAGAAATFVSFDRSGASLVTGTFGLHIEDAGQSAQVSKVRLYGIALSAITDNGSSIQTNHSRQRVFLSGAGWKPGTPGSPTFMGAFTPNASDGGTAPALVSQSIETTGAALLYITGGTAQGILTLTDPASMETTAIPVLSDAPAVVTTGFVTAKTYNGANSVRMDGTDETDRFQDFIDFLMRYRVKGLLEPGRVSISRPLVHSQPWLPLSSSSTGPSAGFMLEGLAGQSYTPDSGCAIQMIAAGQRAVWEIGPHWIEESSIKNVGFFGAPDTLRTVYAPVTNWSGYVFDNCSFSGGNTGIDIDNEALVPPYTSHGGNGESMEFLHCALGGRNILYRNASKSGQAYTHRFERCQGGATVNGGIFAQVGSVAGGGVQLDVRSLSLSMTPGPLANILLDVTNGIENINFWGGRVEHMQTAVRYGPAGYSYTGIVNIDGLTFTGTNEGPGGPLVKCARDGPSSLIVDLSHMLLQSSQMQSSQIGSGDGKLQLLFGGSSDNTVVVLDANQLEYVAADSLALRNVVARTNVLTTGTLPSGAAGNLGVRASDTYATARGASPP